MCGYAASLSKCPIVASDIVAIRCYNREQLAARRLAGGPRPRRPPGRAGPRRPSPQRTCIGPGRGRGAHVRATCARGAASRRRARPPPGWGRAYKRASGGRSRLRDRLAAERASARSRPPVHVRRTDRQAEKETEREREWSRPRCRSQGVVTRVVPPSRDLRKCASRRRQCSDSTDTCTPSIFIYVQRRARAVNVSSYGKSRGFENLPSPRERRQDAGRRDAPQLREEEQQLQPLSAEEAARHRHARRGGPRGRHKRGNDRRSDRRRRRDPRAREPQHQARGPEQVEQEALALALAGRGESARRLLPLADPQPALGPRLREVALAGGAGPARGRLPAALPAAAALPHQGRDAAGGRRARPPGRQEGPRRGHPARERGGPRGRAPALPGRRQGRARRAPGPLRRARGLAPLRAPLPAALPALPGRLPLPRGRALPLVPAAGLPALLARAPLGLALAAARRPPRLPRGGVGGDDDDDDPAARGQALVRLGRALGQPRALRPLAHGLARLGGLLAAALAAARHPRGPLLAGQRQRQVLGGQHLRRPDEPEARGGQGRTGAGLAPLPVPRLRQVLLDVLGPEQAPAVPLRGGRGPGQEDLHLQVLREGLPDPGRPQDAHKDAHAAVQVPPVRQGVLAALAAPGPHQDPHGREALQLPALQARVRRQEQPQGPPADPQRRQEVLVQLVQQDLQQDVAADEAPGGRLPGGRGAHRLRLLMEAR